MTNIKDRNELLIRLAKVVDAYGADQSRWPDADQVLLRTIVTSDVQAQRLLRDGAALDRILSLAQDCDASATHPKSLADRIMGRIHQHADRGSGEPAQHSAEIVVLPRRKSTSGAPMSASEPVRTRWMAAAALAASLLIGIVVGQSGTLATTTQAAFQLAGLAPVSESTALDEDDYGFDFEGLL